MEQNKGPVIIPTALGLAVAQALIEMEEQDQIEEAIRKLRSLPYVATVDWMTLRSK